MSSYFFFSLAFGFNGADEGGSLFQLLSMIC